MFAAPGMVPWEARGVFGDFSTEREDSYPIAQEGWKASQASVTSQVASALNTDIGVTTATRPTPDCGFAQSGCGPAVAELPDEFLNKLTA